MTEDREHRPPASEPTDTPTPLDRADADERIGPDANAGGIETVVATSPAHTSGASQNNLPRPL